VEFISVPFADDSGQMIGIAAIMRDVTARFEELRALRRQLAAHPRQPRGQRQFPAVTRRRKTRNMEGSHMPAIETALTRLLAIEHTIMLAPMGSAAGGKLASAVTNAGGLGMIGSGQADITTIRTELSEAGNARVGIGFITWALERNPAALEVALDARPAAVMLSFGDPTPFTGRIKATGCKIICQVQTLAQAKEAADA